jgi:hypothetical protein
MISDTSSVIAKYLNIWSCQAICSQMIDRPSNFLFTINSTFYFLSHLVCNFRWSIRQL